ncbi:MAG: IPT/TIG domain-containing protein [Bryobacteraceae bacterium]
MTVNGSGFVAGAMVEWNGLSLATTFVNFTQLTASVPSTYVASPGRATVTVVSGGATSNGATFTIGPPAPTITSTIPASATAGGAGFTLTINGTGYVPQSTVTFNCNDAPTYLTSTFVSATQLTAFVPASLIASPENCILAVYNPLGTGEAVSDLDTYVINPAVKLSILTTSPLPSGTLDVPYSLALSATGGVPPYSNWTLTSGSLPAGMSLTSPSNLITGLITGVPTSAGTFTFSVQVSDSLDEMASATLSLTIVQVPVISANGIVNAASYVTGGVAPGEMITIFGSGLGPATLAPLQTDQRGYVSTTLGGTQVLFDGTPAPLIYSLAGQVSAVVPYETFGKSSTQVQVVFQGQSSSTVSVPVVTALPGVFTLNSSGSGPGAIVNQDGTVNSATNPAAAGSIVMIFATGEGQTNPDGTDGKPDGFPAPAPIAPVSATIGGLNADVQYAGGVAGLVAGFLQVNVRLPSGVSTSSAVPVILSIGGKSSQANVTLAVAPPGIQ